MQNSCLTVPRPLVLALFAIFVAPCFAGVKRVDLKAGAGFSVNAAGPLIVRADEARGRVVLANTLTSSLTVISCADGRVENIPLGRRVPHFLKAEALAVRKSTGEVYLIGNRCLMVADPATGKSRTIPTPPQFDAVAVDDATGNAFLAGQGTRFLGFVPAGSPEARMVPWLDREEEVVNLNMSPKPPMRKVIADQSLGVVAVDGFTSTLFRFKASDASPAGSRKLNLNAGGRWHLAGYREATHHLYLVTETEDRKALQAARIGVADGEDKVVPLPGLTEPVGVAFSAKRDEAYIAYDNHPSVHVVEFKDAGRVSEIPVPGYGNDAVAVDEAGGLLYVASWAWADLISIDLDRRAMVGRKPGVGVLPHQFSMAFQPADGKLYIPLGATAVNGSFGAAVTAWDPATGKLGKIRTGWAPVDLVRAPGSGFLTVLSSEDEGAAVYPDGRVARFTLPVPYPVCCAATPDGKVAVSYGAHQSWWPAVYIRGARNGVLLINPDGGGVSTDRRIPRQAQKIAVDRAGRLVMLQNNWGKEKQFLSALPDAVREWDPGTSRFETGDEVESETTQRLLALDEARGFAYAARIGENGRQNGVLHVLDLKTLKPLHRVETGRTPTGLAVEADAPAGEPALAAVANFDSDTVTVTSSDGPDFAVHTWKTGRQPLRVAFRGGRLWVLTHGGRSLESIDPATGVLDRYPVPFDGLPDSFQISEDGVWIAVYRHDALGILKFDIEKKTFSVEDTHFYPYGETALDSGNCAFFNRGQFGDALFSLSRMAPDVGGGVWIADFLSGTVFIAGRDVR